MSDQINCDHCGKIGYRRRRECVPAEWYFADLNCFGFVGYFQVAACSRDCCTPTWTPNPKNEEDALLLEGLQSRGENTTFNLKWAPGPGELDLPSKVVSVSDEGVVVNVAPYLQFLVRPDGVVVSGPECSEPGALIEEPSHKRAALKAAEKATR